MSQELKKQFHCCFNLSIHLVLVTKYRRKCINEVILADLHSVFRKLCDRWDANLLEFNGEPDHVHLLIELNPKITPSIFVNNLKTVSSRLIRRDHLTHLKKFYWKDPVFWSRSYCILTCGGAPLSVLKQYIEQQSGVD
jgi:REP-associated tyrosine transposase